MFTRSCNAISDPPGYIQSNLPAFEIDNKISNSGTAAKIYDQIIDRLRICERASTDPENPAQAKNRIKTHKIRNVLFHNGLLDPATKGSWTLTEMGLIALAFRLLDDEPGESQEAKNEVSAATMRETVEDAAFHSQILENDSENLTALKYFLKLNRHNEKTAGEWFVKIIHATMKRDFQSAVHLVRDYFPKHLQLLSGDILFRIGVEFFRCTDYEMARFCLGMASEKEGSWQHKAMLILSRCWEALGNQERAVAILLDLLEQKPAKLFRLQAFERLRILKESQIENLQELTIAA
jgi:hypothetical protein